MGVRGLTSYIARHAELYLKPYELHDCSLVIDGDNLACNLYKDVSGKNSAFGGDYDSFYRSVVEFFHVLSECNIRSYVLMDGGYEKKKLRTVWQRLRGKVAGIKRVDPLNSYSIFPLMMREVFVDALNDCAIPVMRCVFEGDDELATLSRKLDCPVLSYDSDFYIHNVKYIPLVTLTVKAHKKKVSQKSIRKNAKLTQNSARHIQKLTKAHKIVKDIQVDSEDRKAPKSGKTYKYLDCCMYKVEHLVARGSLSKEKLPLFAALLGNDYIPRSAFKSFFSQMKKNGMGKKSSRLHKRVQKIIQWLKHETLDSALEKILGTLKQPQRNRLLAQVQGAVEGYASESCASYEFFKSYYDDYDTDDSSDSEGDDDSDEEQDEECVEEDEADEEYITEEDNQSEEEEEETSTVLDEEDDDGLVAEVDEVPAAEETTYLSAHSKSSEDEENDDDDEDNERDSTEFLPQWFKDRLYPAHLPRFLVDLAHLRIYINNPQIEHFPFNDCNEIGLPILKHTFALLNYIEGREEDKIFKEDPSTKKIAETPTNENPETSTITISEISANDEDNEICKAGPSTMEIVETPTNENPEPWTKIISEPSANDEEDKISKAEPSTKKIVETPADENPQPSTSKQISKPSTSKKYKPQMKKNATKKITEPPTKKSAETTEEEVVPYFRYVTRLPRVTNVHTVRYPLGPPPKTPFNPSNPDPELFRSVFRNLKLDVDKLFTEINKIPSDLRLYFLALVYWIQKTPHADLLHLHALLICLVVLRTVDSKVEPIRDPRAFQKQFGNIIKKEKLNWVKEQEEGTVKEMRPEITELSPPDRMIYVSRVDCILVQDHLLKHFHMQEVFKKKYDDFSTTVLHGFSEFQSVVFNLHGLNGLLGKFYESPKMGQAYCGVFLYNIYDLLRSRIDIKYFIEHHVFQYSPMVFDLYDYFWTWCEQFIPEWQKTKVVDNLVSTTRNILKKKKAAAKKKEAEERAAAAAIDPNDETSSESESESSSADADALKNVFYDLNNKFSQLLKLTEGASTK